MRDNVRFLAGAVAALLLLSACGGGSLPGVSQTPSGGQVDSAFQSLAEKPLNFPDASAGNCPVTPSVLLSPTLPMTVGDGPFYATGLGSETVMHVSGNGGSLQGSIGFLADGTFSGKALVRGEQIDGSGGLTFTAVSPGQVDPTGLSLELDTTQEDTPPDGDLWGWNSAVEVGATGCYAIQIDTDQTSQVIVFSVDVG